MTGPNSFLRMKRTNATELNNCCPRMSARVPSNCHLMKSVTVLREHCSAGAAFAAELPAAVVFHSEDCCIAAVVPPAGSIHVVPVVCSGVAGWHHFRGYCGSAGWYIRCSAWVCCSSVKSTTGAPVLAGGWSSGVGVADPADGYRLPCPGLNFLLREKPGGTLFPQFRVPDSVCPGLCIRQDHCSPEWCALSRWFPSVR